MIYLLNFMSLILIIYICIWLLIKRVYDETVLVVSLGKNTYSKLSAIGSFVYVLVLIYFDILDSYSIKTISYIIFFSTCGIVSIFIMNRRLVVKKKGLMLAYEYSLLFYPFISWDKIKTFTWSGDTCLISLKQRFPFYDTIHLTIPHGKKSFIEKYLSDNGKLPPDTECC